jgi:putative colanic acid biosynthesis acetyltransferase WcaF
MNLTQNTESTPSELGALDIAANRQARKYSKVELAKRVLWGFGRLFFRFSPRPCFAWRRFVLRCFGAKIGAQVNTYPSTWVYFPWNLTVGAWSAIGEQAFIYNLGPVTLGEKVTVSHRAQLCAGTHDYTKPDLPLIKPPIVIQDQAWVCADAFVGPGVTIGEGAIVGARAVVTKSVAPWTIVAGNPAKIIKKRVLSGPSSKP